MRCKHCGFENQETFDRCPACGKLQSDPVEPETAPAPEPAPIREESAPQEQTAVPRYNRMTVVGFILSCSSLVISFLGLNALVGLIFSTVGLSELRFAEERGKGLAVAGIAIAIVSLIINVFAIIYVFQLLVTGKLDEFIAAAQI